MVDNDVHVPLSNRLRRVTPGLFICVEYSLRKNSSLVVARGTRLALGTRRLARGVAGLALGPRLATATAAIAVLALSVLALHEGAASSAVGKENAREHDKGGKEQETTCHILQLGEPRVVGATAPSSVASEAVAGVAAASLHRRVITAQTGIERRARMRVLNNGSDKVVATVSTFSLASIVVARRDRRAVLVRPQLVVETAELIVRLSGRLHAIVITEILQGEGSIIRASKSNVIAVHLFAVGQIASVPVVAVIVSIVIVHGERTIRIVKGTVVNELLQSIGRDKLLEG